MNTLRSDYKLCKNELASMKRDQSSKRVTRSMSKTMKDESEAADPRKALFAAIQSRSGATNESPKKKENNSDPRQALFSAIKNKKKDETTGKDNDVDSPTSVKHTPGVHRLSKFLIHSKSILCSAEKDQEGAIRGCKVCCYRELKLLLFFLYVYLTMIILFLLTGSCCLLWRGWRRKIRSSIITSSIRVCFVSRKWCQKI